MANRRRISACLGDFDKEIKRLRSIKFHSQSNLNISLGRPKKNYITKRQMHLIQESTYFATFRTFENFIEEIFLLYCMGKRSQSGTHGIPYLAPTTYAHAADMIKSSQQFLDWSSPDIIIERSELYLKDGEPFKLVISSNINKLRSYKHLRNHIAHNSNQSRINYLKVLNNFLRTVPTTIPTPGEFLSMNDPRHVGNTFLDSFIDDFERIAITLAE